MLQFSPSAFGSTCQEEVHEPPFEDPGFFPTALDHLIVTMSAIDSGNLAASSTKSPNLDDITIASYAGEHQMSSITSLIEKELSEPYIVYTYRYFVNQWPSLCFLSFTPSHEAVGVIVCKLDRHLKGSRLMRGYIAMISVKHSYRGKGLGKRLVTTAVEEMVKRGAQEVVLETESDNEGALALYESLGFMREKRLHRFYLNGKDSFRLVLPIPEELQQPIPPELDMPPPTGLVQPPYPPSTPQEATTSVQRSAYTHGHVL